MISKWIEHLDEWAESGDLALVKVKALLQSDTLNPTKLRELADEPQKGQYVRQVLHHHDGYELV